MTASHIAATSRSAGNLDLFTVGSDGVVRTTWWYAGNEWGAVTGGWRPIGGFFPPNAQVTAIAKSPNSIDLFVVGNDGRVYTSWWYEGQDWSGVNNNWRSIGGFFPPGAPLSVTSRHPGNLDVFVTGKDGRIYTSWWYAGSDWSGIHDNWRSIGGFFPAGAPVTAIAKSPNSIDVFVVGNDGRVYTSWWYEGQDWSGIHDNWRGIGGFFPARAPLAVTSRHAGNLDVFVTGNDGRVYTSWWYAGSDWSGIHDNWRGLGGFFPKGAAVSAVAKTPQSLDLFITGNDGRVYTSWWYEGQDWSGIHDNWRRIGGFFPAGAPVRAISKSPTSLDLFISGNDQLVYTEWWNAGSEWSGINDNWRPLVPAQRHPTITLRAIQVSGEGRFVEVTGAGFTPGNAVKVAYDLVVGGAPTSHTFGEDSLASDGAGRFVHRIRVASAISAANVQAVDVASGVKATASL